MIQERESRRHTPAGPRLAFNWILGLAAIAISIWGLAAESVMTVTYFIFLLVGIVKLPPVEKLLRRQSNRLYNFTYGILLFGLLVSIGYIMSVLY